MSTLVFRSLRIEDQDAAVRAHRLLAAEGFGFLPAWNESEPWRDYVRFLDDIAHGDRLPEQWVATTYLAGTEQGRLVGRVSLRHELTEELLQWGGHIGYAVLPEYRGRGSAKEMVRLLLPRARRMGIRQVLITCDDDNVASAAVIEACGGVLEDRRQKPAAGLKRRYWVPTAPALP